jgi:formylmethanofuran dehydrogenase subunit E
VNKAVTFGADPEFELVIDGRVVSAQQVIRRSVKLPWGIIGYDGAGAPLELRPNPSTSPNLLVKNVGRLLLSVPVITGGFPSTMGEMHAIGGHVHIGIRRLTRKPEAVADAVDKAVGDILYNMNTATRLRSSYGKRGDWRRQAWGVEYRTPPSTMWAHPEVALAFVKAIKRVVSFVLDGKDFASDDKWPAIRYKLADAATLVMQHNGRIHWDAWKEFVGEDVEKAASEASVVNCNIRIGGEQEYDEKFASDMGAMFARLGIRDVVVLVFSKSYGDYASNVRRYGSVRFEFGPYEGEEGGLAQPLMLSWRFCNDPAFRAEELPKLEAAIASQMRKKDIDDRRIVKGVVRLSSDWDDDEKEEAAELEAVETSPHTFICDSCGNEVSSEEAIFVDESLLCEDCYHETYGTCVACEGVFEPEGLNYVYGGAYCDDCFYEYFTTCEACGEAIERDEAYSVWDADYCEGCFERRFVACDECGEPVRRVDVIRQGDERYCEDCYRRVFVECEMCEATIRRDEAHVLSGEAFCRGCYNRAVAEEEELEAA